MWELDYKESWAPKNWCFWTVVLEKTLESPLDCKEIQPVHPKGNQSWVFIGRTDVEAETAILWPPDAKSWLIWKDPDAGKDWRGEEKGTTEDEMVGWQWTWVWVDSESWWWTGRPGVLRFMGSQRVGHSWAELNWITLWGWSYYYYPYVTGRKLKLRLNGSPGSHSLWTVCRQRWHVVCACRAHGAFPVPLSFHRGPRGPFCLSRS